MLGAHAPSELEHERQHRVVDGLVLRRGPEHVDVQVSVADVAVDDRPRIGRHGCDRGGCALDQLRVARRGHRDVQLVRHALGVDDLGVALSELPQPFPLVGDGGDRHRCLVDRKRLQGGEERLGRIGLAGGDLDQR